MNKPYPIWLLYVVLINSFVVSMMGCLFSAHGLYQFINAGSEQANSNFFVFIIGTVTALYFFPKIKQYWNIIKQAKIVNELTASANKAFEALEGFADGERPELEKDLEEKVKVMLEANIKLNEMMPLQPKKEENK